MAPPDTTAADGRVAATERSAMRNQQHQLQHQHQHQHQQQPPPLAERAPAVITLVRQDALTFRRATPDDLPAIKTVENEGFLPEEVESLDAIRARLLSAGQFFFVLAHTAETRPMDDPSHVLGYINATRTNSAVLTHKCMETHEPAGHTLVITSVALRPRYQRQRLGSTMFARYMEHVRGAAASLGVRRAMLMCKQHMIGFYERYGFELDGPAAFEYGPDPWFQMSQALD